MDYKSVQKNIIITFESVPHHKIEDNKFSDKGDLTPLMYS